MAAEGGQSQEIGLEPGAPGRVSAAECEHDGRQGLGGRHVAAIVRRHAAIVLATALFAR
jgi:hypothetical protein